MAAAIRELSDIGMDAVAAHEAELTAHTLSRISEIPNVKVFADTKPERASSRLGVIPFQIKDLDHFLVAAILGHEFGIGVRNGCFCAHPLILHLLGLSEEEANQVRDEMLEQNKAEMPGLIRASFGLYNTIKEIDTLIDALEKIAKADFAGKYAQDILTGEYTPIGWAPDFDQYFTLR